MPEKDYYTLWLDVPPGKRPPDYYTLLGIPKFCRDESAINWAVHEQLTKLDAYQNLPDKDAREACVKLKNELAQAGVTLLDNKKRIQYDKGIAAGDKHKTPSAKKSARRASRMDTRNGHSRAKQPEKAKPRSSGFREKARDFHPIDEPDILHDFPDDIPEGTTGQEVNKSESGLPRGAVLGVLAGLALLILAFLLLAFRSHIFEHAEPSLSVAHIETIEDIYEAAQRGNEDAISKLKNLSHIKDLRTFWGFVIRDDHEDKLWNIVLYGVTAKCKELRKSYQDIPEERLNIDDVNMLLRELPRISMTDRAKRVQLLLDLIRTPIEDFGKGEIPKLIMDEYDSLGQKQGEKLLESLLFSSTKVYYTDDGSKLIGPVDAMGFAIEFIKPSAVSADDPRKTPTARSDQLQNSHKTPKDRLRTALATRLSQSWNRVPEKYKSKLVAPVAGILKGINRLEFVGRCSTLTFDSEDIPALRDYLAAGSGRAQSIQKTLSVTDRVKLILACLKEENPGYTDIVREELPGLPLDHRRNLLLTLSRSDRESDRKTAGQVLSKMAPQDLTEVVGSYLDSNDPTDPAARTALEMAGLRAPCELILLFLKCSHIGNQEAGIRSLECAIGNTRKDVLKQLCNDMGGRTSRLFHSILDSDDAPASKKATAAAIINNAEDESLREKAFFVLASDSGGDRQRAVKYVKEISVDELDKSIFKRLEARPVYPDVLESIMERFVQKKRFRPLAEGIWDLQSDTLGTALDILHKRAKTDPTIWLKSPITNLLVKIVGSSDKADKHRIRALEVLLHLNKDKVKENIKRWLKEERRRTSRGRRQDVLDRLEEVHEQLYPKKEDVPQNLPGRSSRNGRTRTGSRR